ARCGGAGGRRRARGARRRRLEDAWAQLHDSVALHHIEAAVRVDGHEVAASAPAGYDRNVTNDVNTLYRAVVAVDEDIVRDIDAPDNRVGRGNDDAIRVVADDNIEDGRSASVEGLDVLIADISDVKARTVAGEIEAVNVRYEWATRRR